MDRNYSNLIGWQGANQTAPFSILQSIHGAYINKRLPNHGQQYGMVQSSLQPSNHIATDENRKILNRGLASKLIFNCIDYVVAQRSQSIDW